MVLQLPSRRPDRLEMERHPRLLWRASALFEIARRTRGRDIFPSRPATLGARDNMIEREIVADPAILALEFIAQEQIKPRKCWMR